MKNRSFWLLLIGIAGFMAMEGVVSAQQSATAFDLMIYGQNFNEDNVSVDLKVNPGTNDRWERVSDANRENMHLVDDRSSTLMVIQDLDSSRFVGQDIRENYIELRLTSKAKDAHQPIHIRGFWVLNHQNEIDRDQLQSLLNSIQNHPAEIQYRSFANLVYPRDRVLEDGDSFIDHIELPVRHLKAGVQEVRWLQILFTR